MLSKSSKIKLLGLFMVLGNFCFASEYLPLSQDTFSDSIFNYSIVVIKEDLQSCRVIVKIEAKEEGLKEVLESKMRAAIFNTEMMKAKLKNEEIYTSNDVIVEDYISSLRLVYIYSNINIKNIQKFIFNHSTEINILL